jgi:hypothetical protein
MTKPEKLVNIQHSIETGNNAISSDRRAFMRGVGIAVLTVQCLPLIANAAGNAADGDNLIIQSGPGAFGHVHDLLIPKAVLKTPPVQGVALTSTKAFLHQHNIKLTQKELTLVNQGGTVTQKASSHLFVIALAKGQDHM